jgi:peptidyl-prolyl cis-trans isomerase B (cyclophilin B)
MTKRSLIIVLAGVLAVSLCFGATVKQEDVDKKNDSVKEKKVETKKVKLETNYGDIVIELNEEKAPVTVKNFIQYTNEGFYNGTVFHRVIKDFMIQGGGFDEKGTHKNTHSPIINEAKNGLKNDRGTIAMARTNDPNSATAQFFINHKTNDFLNYSGPQNPGYAVFGKVVEGMDVVDKIAAVKTGVKFDMRDVPMESIIVKSAKVVTDTPKTKK